MGWVFAALIVVVIGFAFVASAGRLGQLAPQVDDRPVPALPSDRRLEPGDLENLEFAVVPRGYSMEQVEALLDRVADEMAAAADQSPPRRNVPTDALGPVSNGWPTSPWPDQPAK